MRSTRSLVWPQVLSALLALIAPSVGIAQEPSELFSLPPLTDLSAIVDKPLFSPDRRPPPDADQTDQPVAAAEPSEGTDRQIGTGGNRH